MAGSLNIAGLVITPGILKRVSGIDEFKGAWRAIERHAASTTLCVPWVGVASVMFALVLILLGWMGAWVARYFSEPMNRLLRNRWGRRSTGLHVAASESA